MHEVSRGSTPDIFDEKILSAIYKLFVHHITLVYQVEKVTDVAGKIKDEKH